MEKEKEIGLSSEARKYALFSIISLATLILGYIFVPHFTGSSFADEPVVETDAVTLTVNPIDPVNRYNLKVVTPGPDGVFNTIGIEAKVTTENSYGYQLSMRSKTAGAKLVNKRTEFATESFIAPIGSSIDVDYANNRFFNEKNAYGWSTNWNPNSQTGTFNPVANYDTVVKKTLAAVEDDVTNIYLGTLITEDLMFGKYDGTLVLTAVTNSYNDTHTTYHLNYDPNAVSGAVTNMPVSPVDKEISAAQTGPVYFELDTTNIPVRSGFNFRGWDTNSHATAAAYKYDGSAWTIPTYVDGTPVVNVIAENTTLYAIWSQNFTLNFNANGGTGGPGTMNCESVSYCEFIIPDNKPVSAAGDFLGWSTSSVSTTAEYPIGSSYRVMDTAPTATLYAVYGVKSFENAFKLANMTKLNGYYRLQDMSATICNNISTGQTGSLIDTRNGVVYEAAKLDDGNCVMSGNIQLGSELSDWTTTLTSNNSDVTSDFTLGPSTTSSLWSEETNEQAYIISGGKYYYNRYTATAGGKGTICPKGWTIPADGPASNSIGSLFLSKGITSSNSGTLSLNNTSYTEAPLSFTPNGYVDYTTGTLTDTTNVHLWSSTPASNEVKFGNGTGVFSGLATDSRNGIEVRCVAKTASDLSSGNTNPLGEDTIDLPENVLEVIKLINSLPKPEDVKLSDGELIEKVRAAYEALTDEEKAMISPDLLKKYNSVLAAYYSLVDANSSNDKLIIAACAGAAVATTTLTVLLIMKKKEEDDDEDINS